jgi:hypothetical protein
MRRFRIPLLCFLALAAQARPARAQENPQMGGSWSLDREQSDDVNVKINASISRMNVVVRQIARPRLRATNIPYPQLIFAFDQDVRVDMPGYPSVASPMDGAPVLWHRRTGRECPAVHGSCVEVTTTWEEGRLIQTFRSLDGQRQNVFVVSADGATLTMAVTMTSPRLPAPLTYRLVYTRGS